MNAIRAVLKRGAGLYEGRFLFEEIPYALSLLGSARRTYCLTAVHCVPPTLSVCAVLALESAFCAFLTLLYLQIVCCTLVFAHHYLGVLCPNAGTTWPEGVIGLQEVVRALGAIV